MNVLRARLLSLLCATVAIALGSTAQAAVVTGDFNVTSTSGNLITGDLGGTLSDHDKMLNVSMSLNLPANTAVSHDLFGVNDFSIAGLGTSFTGLSDGSAAISCSGGCTASGGNFLSFISLSPTSFSVDFADGGTLQIVDSLFRSYEDYTFTFTPGNAPVPEPLSLATLGAGLIGLAVSRRRKRSAAQV